MRIPFSALGMMPEPPPDIPADRRGASKWTIRAADVFGPTIATLARFDRMVAAVVLSAELLPDPTVRDWSSLRLIGRGTGQQVRVLFLTSMPLRLMAFATRAETIELMRIERRYRLGRCPRCGEIHTPSDPYGAN